jgi:hypothetical protein
MLLRLRFPAVLILTSLLFLTPALAFAAGLPAQIVSCTGVNCTVCDIATTAQNVLNTGIFVMVFLSAVLFAYAGWEALTAAGNTEKYAHAKSIFGNVVLGLVIILSAWLVIDTLMRTMLGSGFGPWNAIC